MNELEKIWMEVVMAQSMHHLALVQRDLGNVTKDFRRVRSEIQTENLRIRV
jgi:hypothetical protein